MGFSRIISELAAHLLFPQSCPVCGTLGVDICRECLQKLLSKPILPRCLACSGPVPCSCHGTRYSLRALCAHEGAQRNVLLAAKYERRGTLALKLGRALAPLIDEDERWSIATIPPHKRLVLFPRGDDHLAWMVRGLSEATGYPVKELLAWNIRQKPQKEQKSREARKKLPTNCFRCVTTPPECILLLDDVCTTGTTLFRAAQTLYAAGAKKVCCLCWSRAVE